MASRRRGVLAAALLAASACGEGGTTGWENPARSVDVPMTSTTVEEAQPGPNAVDGLLDLTEGGLTPAEFFAVRQWFSWNVARGAHDDEVYRARTAAELAGCVGRDLFRLTFDCTFLRPSASGADEFRITGWAQWQPRGPGDPAGNLVWSLAVHVDLADWAYDENFLDRGAVRLSRSGLRGRVELGYDYENPAPQPWGPQDWWSFTSFDLAFDPAYVAAHHGGAGASACAQPVTAGSWEERFLSAGPYGEARVSRATWSDCDTVTLETGARLSAP